MLPSDSVMLFNCTTSPTLTSQGRKYLESHDLERLPLGPLYLFGYVPGTGRKDFAPNRSAAVHDFDGVREGPGDGLKDDLVSERFKPSMAGRAS